MRPADFQVAIILEYFHKIFQNIFLVRVEFLFFKLIEIHSDYFVKKHGIFFMFQYFIVCKKEFTILKAQSRIVNDILGGPDFKRFTNILVARAD